MCERGTWITVAETCEFIIALTMSGNITKAKKILIEVLNISDKKNIIHGMAI